MRATNERLTILSEAEQAALYELPDFDDDQRLEYLTLTDEEQALALRRPHLSAKIYCMLQIGYFKAKKLFFQFGWDDAKDDIKFILQQYFQEQDFSDRQSITKHEHYAQCNLISFHFNYRSWSKNFEPLARDRAKQIILRDVNPQFIAMELLNYLQEQKIIRPRYSTLQIIIRNVLNNERKRLGCVINESLCEEEKTALKKLLLKEDVLSELAALKQDAKDFKARMMTAEREKLAMITPLYQVAKMLLPKLQLSQQNIHYYSSLVSYYSIHELRKRIAPSQTYLYLLCYILLRYQQLTDNLNDAFCHHLKQFEQEIKTKAKEAFYHHQKQEQNEQALMKRFAGCFIDKCFPNDIPFGDVRHQAFKIILPEDELRDKLSASHNKPNKEIDFQWEYVDKIGHRFKNHLRPLAMALNFTSIVANNPWLNSLSWFKTTFQKQESLNQQSILNCPEGTIPKRLSKYLLKTSKDGEPNTLHSERYEFWIYRQIKKRLRVGELYLAPHEGSYHETTLR